MADIRTSSTAGERIAEILVEEAKSGVLSVGQQLPSERMLAERFGVSRPTVHHAVQIMARQGYAAFVEGRRPRVSMPGPRTLEGFPPEAVAAILQQEDGHASLEQLRQIIEVGAVGVIARGGAISHIGRLMVPLRQGEEASTPEEFIAADVAFHRALIACIENPIVANLHDSFIKPIFYRRLTLAQDGSRWPRVLQQHRDIVDAIRIRDHLKAAGILEEHLMDAYTTSLLPSEPGG